MFTGPFWLEMNLKNTSFSYRHPTSGIQNVSILQQNWIWINVSNRHLLSDKLPNIPNTVNRCETWHLIQNKIHFIFQSTRNYIIRKTFSYKFFTNTWNYQMKPQRYKNYHAIILLHIWKKFHTKFEEHLSSDQRVNTNTKELSHCSFQYYRKTYW